MLLLGKDMYIVCCHHKSYFLHEIYIMTFLNGFLVTMAWHIFSGEEMACTYGG